MSNVLNNEESIEKEINRLQKKYQDKPNTLIEDYDNVIKQSLIGIIANFNTSDILRNDIISQIEVLIRSREFIINQYSNNSSN